MFGRTLGSAALAVAFCLSVATTARAQNLEAGKSPTQIFRGACSVCHKSPRGLVKSVPPNALPGFLRQHYTTSSDMAAMLSGYLLANGATDRRYGNERPGRGRAAGPTAAEAPQETAAPRHRRRPRHDAQPGQTASEGGASQADGRSAHKPSKRRAKSKSKPAGEDAGSGEKPAAESGAKPTSDAAAPKAETSGGKEGDLRPDPVPAVTPAPKSSEAGSGESKGSEPKSSEPKAAEPKAD